MLGLLEALRGAQVWKQPEHLSVLCRLPWVPSETAEELGLQALTLGAQVRVCSRRTLPSCAGSLARCVHEVPGRWWPVPGGGQGGLDQQPHLPLQWLICLLNVYLTSEKGTKKLGRFFLSPGPTQ